MNFADVLSGLAMTVQEPMDRAGLAHLLESLSQCAPSAMKSNVDVVQRRPEARSQPVSRLAEDVGAPNDIRILWLEGGQ